MVDEISSIKNAIKKTISPNSQTQGDEDLGDRVVSRLARDAINQVLSKAGKGKDDLILIVGREIGLAVAAMLKEPLDQLVEGKKLRISLELVSKDDQDKAKAKARSKGPSGKRGRSPRS